jgi:HSP90 family molecular chaperone
MEPPDKLHMPDMACGKMVLCAQLFRTRKPDEYKKGEYDKSYGSTTDNMIGPMTQIHNIAENKVTIKSLIIYPHSQPPDLFNKHEQAAEMTKLYTRGVFVTNDFMDMMPSDHISIKSVPMSPDLRGSREDYSRPSQKQKILMTDKMKEYTMTTTRNSPYLTMRSPAP